MYGGQTIIDRYLVVWNSPGRYQAERNSSSSTYTVPDSCSFASAASTKPNIDKYRGTPSFFLTRKSVSSSLDQPTNLPTRLSWEEELSWFLQSFLARSILSISYCILVRRDSKCRSKVSPKTCTKFSASQGALST